MNTIKPMKDEGNLVSVIVPAYNAEKTIEKCVRSIMAQTYTKLEIILVDDGSTDQTGAIIDSLAGMDSRIRTIHKENTGVGYARNTGSEVANGDFICFCDADDYVSDRWVEVLYYAFQYPIELSICGFFRVKDTCVSQIDEPGPYSLLEKTDIWDLFLKQQFNVVWNKMYIKKIIIDNDVRFGRGKNGEDLIFNLHYLSHVNMLSWNSSSQYYYYDNKNSVTHNYVQNMWGDTVERMNLLRVTMEKCGCEFERIRPGYYEVYEGLVERCTRNCILKHAPLRGKIGEIHSIIVSESCQDVLRKARRTTMHPLLRLCIRMRLSPFVYCFLRVSK